MLPRKKKLEEKAELSGMATRCNLGSQKRKTAQKLSSPQCEIGMTKLKFVGRKLGEGSEDSHFAREMREIRKIVLSKQSRIIQQRIYSAGESTSINDRTS